MTEYASVFTIHTKDGPLRRERYSYTGKKSGTPFCTVTLQSAENIARDKNAVPCVIVETKTGYDSEKDIMYHMTIAHKIEEEVDNHSQV